MQFDTIFSVDWAYDAEFEATPDTNVVLELRYPAGCNDGYNSIGTELDETDLPGEPEYKERKGWLCERHQSCR